MQKLNLYKQRRFTVVKLNDGKEYKIPNEYTVEEVERLLELKKKQEEIESTIAGDSKDDQQKQVEDLYNNMYDQIEIFFQTYHPEMTIEAIKKIISHNEALEIMGFFHKYRALAMGEIQDEDLEAKKKLTS